MLPNTKQWDIGKINSLFSEEVVKSILAVPLLEVVKDDKLIWDHERDGVYSVRSGYRKVMKIRRVDTRPGGMSLMKESRQTAGKMAVLIGSMWQNRNNYVWNESKLSAQQVGIQAAQLWHDWAMIHGCLDDEQTQQQQQTTVQTAIKWKQPPPGYLKCNVDASFYDTAEATGWGWCLRDYRGRFVLAGTNLMYTKLNILEGEAMAIKEALEKFMQRDLTRVIFESDSKVVVNAIHSR
ncbi:hypothetical protein TSUD_200440 [Trifolium subterraneum]|nr:hypothetical protein TSUD_200440 [Trifolium subterraneum]